MKKFFFYFFFLFLSVPKATAQKTIFVNGGTKTSGNGISWQTAYNDLEVALNTATNGTSIWVAKGVYLPTKTNNREIAFLIKKGVKIYGGFDGIETTLAQRNIEKNITILSGNIGNKSDSTDNSYNIVRFLDVDSSNILDGLSIENGFAYTDSEVVSFKSNKKCGGAIYINNDSESRGFPLIENCKFQNNISFQYGGAIFFSIGGMCEPTITLKNCIFINNKSSCGGGIYINNVSQNKGICSINNVTFTNNYAKVYGGAIYTYIENQNFKYEILGTKFLNNKSIAEGGALYMEMYGVNNKVLRIRKSEFDENKSHSGSSISFFAFQNNVPIEPLLDDVIFSNHKGGSVTLFLLGKKDTLNISRCSFKNNTVRNAISCSNLKINNSIFISNLDSLVLIGLRSGTFTKMTNCVFADNLHCLGHQGDYKDSASIIQVHNSLFFNNGEILSTSGYILPLDPNIKNYIFCKAAFYNSIFQDNNISEKFIFTGSSATIDLFNCGIDVGVNQLDLYIKKIKPASIFLIGGQNNILGNFTDKSLLIQPCSPAINAGDNNYAKGLLTDFDGKPRVLHGKIDIGPFEFDDFQVNNFDTKPTVCKSKQGVFIPTIKGNCGNNTSITWKNDQQQSGIGNNNLDAGSYTFYVKDNQNGCVDTVKNVIIEQKGAISANISIQNLNNPTIKNGTIKVTSINNGKAPYQFLWSTGDTTQQIKNLDVGNYSLSVTDANGCFFTIALTVSAASATSDLLESSNLQLVPNPAQNFVHIQDAKGFFKSGTIRIFDLRGQLLLEDKNINNNSKIDITTFSEGMYLWQVTDSLEVVIKGKLMVQR